MMNKAELLKQIYESQERGNDWIRSLPRQQSESFFNNPYVENYGHIATLLMEQVFGYDCDIVHWVLYEWAFNKSTEWTADSGDTVQFDTIDDIVDYLISEGW